MSLNLDIYNNFGITVEIWLSSVLKNKQHYGIGYNSWLPPKSKKFSAKKEKRKQSRFFYFYRNIHKSKVNLNTSKLFPTSETVSDVVSEVNKTESKFFSFSKSISKVNPNKSELFLSSGSIPEETKVSDVVSEVSPTESKIFSFSKSISKVNPNKSEHFLSSESISEETKVLDAASEVSSTESKFFSFSKSISKVNPNESELFPTSGIITKVSMEENKISSSNSLTEANPNESQLLPCTKMKSNVCSKELKPNLTSNRTTNVQPKNSESFNLLVKWPEWNSLKKEPSSDLEALSNTDFQFSYLKVDARDRTPNFLCDSNDFVCDLSSTPLLKQVEMHKGRRFVRMVPASIFCMKTENALDSYAKVNEIDCHFSNDLVTVNAMSNSFSEGLISCKKILNRLSKTYNMVKKEVSLFSKSINNFMTPPQTDLDIDSRPYRKKSSNIMTISPNSAPGFQDKEYNSLFNSQAFNSNAVDFSPAKDLSVSDISSQKNNLTFSDELLPIQGSHFGGLARTQDCKREFGTSNENEDFESEFGDSNEDSNSEVGTSNEDENFQKSDFGAFNKNESFKSKLRVSKGDEDFKSEVGASNEDKDSKTEVENSNEDEDFKSDVGSFNEEEESKSDVWACKEDSNSEVGTSNEDENFQKSDVGAFNKNESFKSEVRVSKGDEDFKSEVGASNEDEYPKTEDENSNEDEEFKSNVGSFNEGEESKSDVWACKEDYVLFAEYEKSFTKLDSILFLLDIRYEIARLNIHTLLSDNAYQATRDDTQRFKVDKSISNSKHLLKFKATNKDYFRSWSSDVSDSSISDCEESGYCEPSMQLTKDAPDSELDGSESSLDGSFVLRRSDSASSTSSSEHSEIVPLFSLPPRYQRRQYHKGFHSWKTELVDMVTKNEWSWKNGEIEISVKTSQREQRLISEVHDVVESSCASMVSHS